MGDRGQKSIGEELVEMANSNPEQVVRNGASYLERAESHYEVAVTLRAMSVAERILGRYEVALELAGRSLEAARSARSDEQELLAVLTKVGPLVSMGRLDEALGLVDSASGLATTTYLRARSAYQRGLILDLSGEVPGAIQAYEAALPAFREADDELMIRSTLQNLGSLRIAVGDLEDAEIDLREALSIAMSRHEAPAISGIKHHLGVLASYRGDIPEALRQLQDSDEIYMSVTGASAPQHVARCEVLMSAGLFKEARDLARQIADANRDKRDAGHLIDALVVAARAAVLVGDWHDAIVEAEAVVDAAARQNRQIQAIEARRLVVEARFYANGPHPRALDDLARVAAELDSMGLAVASIQTHLLRAIIAIDLGDERSASVSLDRADRQIEVPVEVRVQRKLAQALIRRAAGNSRGASAAARSGLRLVDEYQAALGATDLRAGLERHTERLGAVGLGLALESRRIRRILRWMELTRARALRHSPVSGQRDVETERLLARLRQVEAALRQPEKRSDTDLQRERLRLQEQVRSADRTKRSSAQAAVRFDSEWLFESLPQRDLLELAISDDVVVGVHLREGRGQFVEIGSAEAIQREVAHVRFALRRAARTGRPLDPDALDALDRSIFRHVEASAKNLTIVPPPELMAVPWAGLPSLRGRYVSIAPSAEVWWRAHGIGPVTERLLAVGGPDLENALSEVDRIGELYDDAVVLRPGSGVRDVRHGLEDAGVAHLACHATFRVENPMFSSLRLGDGNLSVYDIEQLERPPGLVVLSACDSGYTETRAGDELTGLTSALLSMGSRNVIASIGLVPDSSATSDLMVELHKGLIAGLEPAQALADAQAEAFEHPTRFVSAASFICVGA